MLRAKYFYKYVVQRLCVKSDKAKTFLTFPGENIRNTCSP